MERTTIDFGIDLGTTNSAIAVLDGVTPQIVKNNEDKDITPSAVYLSKKGQIYTGDKAKNALERDISCNDAFIEFKRRMGSDFEYEFPASGQRKRPEELSAEILKSLRGDVAQRTGEDVRAAVITIPAMFEQAQCAATKKAGELAGFEQTALLQEPVAASLAYGFQKEISDKAFWLVFDFGGGTFDAAVMKAEEGDIQIVNHGGDNFLGGADIDWAIIEQLVLPGLREAGNFPGLKRGASEWKAALAKIKRSVEQAKIELSRRESAELEGLVIADADGEPVEFEAVLTRGQVSDLAEPLIVRAADLCRKVLAEKNLAPAALERTILVGGPTLAPYFREILQANLDVPLDFSVDPMTVVARGAAVFAGTQRRLSGTGAAGRAAAVSHGAYAAAVNYNPVGPDEDPRVSGEIAAPDGSSLEGFSLEFFNRQTMWSSGRIPLRESGKFTLRLLAEAGMKNDFDIRLFAPDGSRQTISPALISYTIGMTVKNQTVTNDLAIEIDGNEKSTLVTKGEAYPFKKTNRSFKTNLVLHKGSADELKIPITEGSDPKSDCNKLIGNIVVPAHSLRMDLPIGSDVEVTLAAKEPGVLDATVYIPLLDLEVESHLDIAANAHERSFLLAEAAKERARVGFLSEKGVALGDAARLVDEAEKAANEASDFESKQQAFKAILEVRHALDEAEDAADWPNKTDETEKKIKWMNEAVGKWGDAAQKDEAADIEDEIRRALGRKNADTLQRAVKKADDLLAKVELTRPEWWKGLLAYQYRQRAKMTDLAKADRLFAQGARAIEANDLREMRRVAIQLWDLLPEDVAEEVKRGYGSGLTT